MKPTFAAEKNVAKGMQEKLTHSYPIFHLAVIFSTLCHASLLVMWLACDKKRMTAIS